MVKMTKDKSAYFIDGRKVGNEIAFVYDYRDEAKKVRGKVCAVGEGKAMKKEFLVHRKMLSTARERIQTFLVKSASIDPFYLQKMLENSRFVALWHQAFMLGQPKAISRIYKMRKAA